MSISIFGIGYAVFGLLGVVFFEKK
ncbi:MAG: hypothetical protein LBS23_00785 [Holosporaceae bacterium]|nr:hypothetical protein [Holosporaceae bacterium]